MLALGPAGHVTATFPGRLTKTFVFLDNTLGLKMEVGVIISEYCSQSDMTFGVLCGLTKYTKM